MRRFASRKYGPEEEEYMTTVGFTEYTTVARCSRVYPCVDVRSSVCHVVREEAVMRISLFDIPCQAERTDFTVVAMNSSDVALFVVDRRRKQTVEYALEMLQLCTARRRVLVANFEDSKEEDDMPLTEVDEDSAMLGRHDEVADIVRRYAVEYVECSAKTGVGVEKALKLLHRVATAVAKPVDSPGGRQTREKCAV